MVGDLLELTTRGYKSSDISRNIWEALGVEEMGCPRTQRGEVFPILVKNNTLPDGQEVMFYSVCLDKGKEIPVVRAQIEMSGEKVEWRTSKARQHVVNETAIGSRRTLQGVKFKTLPLKVWEDAHWYFLWRIYLPVPWGEYHEMVSHHSNRG